jgi:YD repeat-containing protein
MTLENPEQRNPANNNDRVEQKDKAGDAALVSPLANPKLTYMDIYNARQAQAKEQMESVKNLHSLHLDGMPQQDNLPMLRDGTVVERDKQGRVTRTDDGKGHVSQFEYIGNSKSPSAATVDGHRIEIHGDNPAFRSMKDKTTYVSMIEAPNEHGDFGYGSEGGPRIRRFHDGAEAAYNEHNRVMQVKDATGKVTSFKYDFPNAISPTEIVNLSGITGKWTRYQGGLPGTDKYLPVGTDSGATGVDLTNLKVVNGEIRYTLSFAARNFGEGDLRDGLIGKLTSVNYVRGRDGITRIEQ